MTRFRRGKLLTRIPIYAQARRVCPVFYSPVMRAWMVTRYDDVVAIAKDPARFSSLESDRSTGEIPEGVREILALGFTGTPGLVNNDPPRHTRLRSRTATEDVDIAGVVIPKARVFNCSLRRRTVTWTSRRAPSASTSIETTEDVSTLRFGRGIHFCIGAPLARAKARIALEQVSLRLHGMRLSEIDSYEYVPSTLFHGLKSLHLAWEQA